MNGPGGGPNGPGQPPSAAGAKGGGWFGLGGGGGGGGGGGKGLWSKHAASLLNKTNTLEQMKRFKRRGYGADGLLQRPELPRDFVSRHAEWSYFVETALLPGYSLKPFLEHRAGCTLQSMQREVPISARAGLTSARLVTDERAGRKHRPNGRFDADAASSEQLLAEIRTHDARAYMHVPRHHCNLPLASDAENRRVHVTLENLKEMALQAEFGLADGDDSMRTVRQFVIGLWTETNRLNVNEVTDILTEMFYLSASLGVPAVRRYARACTPTSA